MYKYAGIGIGVILVSLFAIYMFNYERINPDEIGVWMVNGGQNGIDDYSLRTGAFPVDVSRLTRGFKIPGAPWQVDMDKGTTYSKDNGVWTYDIAYSFKAIRTEGPRICHEYYDLIRTDDFRANMAEKHLNPLIIGLVIDLVSSRGDTAIMFRRTELRAELERIVVQQFKDKGFTLENFRVDFIAPEAVTQAYNARLKAQQAVETAKSMTISAQAESQVSVAKAQAAAETLLIQAKAEAEANRLRSQSLTEQLLREQWIQKWDGKLPTTTGADVSVFKQN